MNYFLIFIILVLCGGAYYQHTEDEQQLAAARQELADTTAQFQKQFLALKAEPAAVVAVKPPAPPPLPAPAPAPVVVPPAPVVVAPPPAPVDPNLLGTFTTLDGRTFRDCKVLKVEADSLVFNHADGITQVPLALLPPDLQKKYGYNAQQAVVETEAQIRYRQQTEQAAPAHP